MIEYKRSYWKRYGVNDHWDEIPETHFYAETGGGNHGGSMKAITDANGNIYLVRTLPDSSVIHYNIVAFPTGGTASYGMMDEGKLLLLNWLENGRFLVGNSAEKLLLTEQTKQYFREKGVDVWTE